MSPAGTPRTCSWVSLAQALAHFAAFPGATEGQEHIKPLHWYVACRLAIEGGFLPDEITPRPPFAVQRTRSGLALRYDPTVAGGGERTVLGGSRRRTSTW
jgi:hypothetical protein